MVTDVPEAGLSTPPLDVGTVLCWAAVEGEFPLGSLETADVGGLDPAAPAPVELAPVGR